MLGEPSHTTPAAPPPAIVARLRRAGCVFAEDEATLIVAEASTPEAIEDSVRRRVAGEPLEYVLGWAEFCGRRVAVSPGVFVPRERTEFLVSEALVLARPSSIIADLCCGSGAIGLVLATSIPGVELHAGDIDPMAVACAAHNVASVGGTVHQGDLFQSLPQRLRGRIDLLVANVPYVPTDAIELLPREARLFEPQATLDGGQDGLDFVRRVATETPQWLTPGGHLLIETSTEQAQEAAAIFDRSGLTAKTTVSTEFDVTIVVGSP